MRTIQMQERELCYARIWGGKDDGKRTYVFFVFRQAACSTHSYTKVEKRKHRNINLNLLINSFVFCSTYFSGYNKYIYICTFGAVTLHNTLAFVCTMHATLIAPLIELCLRMDIGNGCCLVFVSRLLQASESSHHI